MLPGTYRLQDPNSQEFGHLIHGNRLIKANIRITDELRKLWASSAVQAQLQRSNTKLVASDPENTAILEHQLLQVDETIPDPPDPLPEPVEEPPSQVSAPLQRPFVVKIPQKHWLDQIVRNQTEVPLKKVRR